MHPFLQSSWFWVKMAFVAALLGFHHIIHFAFKALQKDRYEKSVAQFHSLGYAGIIFMVFYRCPGSIKEHNQSVL
jgi:uncharacterized membrane protein